MKKLFVIGLIAASIVTLLGTLRVITNAVDRRIPAMETHGPQRAGRGGTISGIVVDMEGNPVSQADVSVRRRNAMTGPDIPAQADKQGRFTITGLEAETYQLYAHKEQDGYAESAGTFYAGPKPIIQEITLRKNEVSSGNVFHVGPKALNLFGHVVDAVTKKPVNRVRITMRRVDNPGDFFQTGVHGSFKVLVPQVPITVEVSAPGYEKKDLGTLMPTAGQINRLKVMLRKSQ
jgi:5-hydroxyisourate hydrolase-like protein (transthyretin family)